MKFCPECGKQQEPGGRFCADCGYAIGAAPAAASAASAPGAQPAAEPATPAAGPAEDRQFAAVGAPGQPGQGYGQGGYGQAPDGQPGHPGHPGHPGQGGYGQAPYGQPTQQRQEQQYPGHPGYGQAQAQVPSGTKRPSPFAGIPISDYVRDGLAFLALFASLFMTWTISTSSYDDPSKAGTRVDVLLITLLSIMSIGVTYLWRAGVFGPTIGYRKIQDIRLLVNLPYVILVLVYFVLSLVSGFGDDDFRFLGNAVAFGLAGAILAAQPRRGEIAPGEVDAARHRRWLFIMLGIVGFMAVTTILQIILLALEVLDYYTGGDRWVLLVSRVVAALLSVAVLGLIALKVFRGSEAWRFAGVALGVGGAFLAVLGLMGVESIPQGFFPGGAGFSILFWMAFGATVSAPSVARTTDRTAAAPADRLAALRPVLLLTLILAAALAVFMLIGLVLTLMEDYDGVATWSVGLVLALLLVAATAVTPKLAARDERSAFVMGSVYAGAVFVLGLILMILFEVQDFDWPTGAEPLPVGTVMSLIMVLTWVMPFAVLAVLWLDKAARAHFKSLPASGNSGTGFAFEGAPARAQVPAIPTPATFLGAQQHQFPQQGQPVQQQAPVEPQQQQAQPQPQPQQAPVHPQQQAPVQEPAAEPTPVQEPMQPAAIESQDQDQDEEVSEDTVRRTPVADPDAALLAEAADPATPLARLQELATHPRARVVVAANPSTYPALLTWLSQLGDPAVNEALGRRK